MPICNPCANQQHPGCQTVNCTCRHEGSTVRALTGGERHDYMQGRGGEIVKTREEGTSQ